MCRRRAHRAAAGPNVEPLEAPPRKIHLTTKAYLGRWTEDGLLRPVDVRFGPQKPKAPAAVAWRLDWWSSDDPALNLAAEQACRPLEAQMPRVFAEVEGGWPLRRFDRGLLAQFIALHILRTDGFRDWLARTHQASLPNYRQQLGDELFAEFSRRALSDTERTQRVLRLVNKVATAIGSMHWTLLTFDEPLLATCDQPVCPVPLGPPEAQHAGDPIAPRGWTNTLEVRFPISPHAALLATWLVAEGSARVAEPDWDIAANLNGAVRAQARQHWFHALGRLPALPPAILREPLTRFEPISPKLLPGYDARSAMTSQLRAGTDDAVNRLIDQNDDTTMILTTPRARPGG
jgi:hypothetical protein